MSDRSSAAKQPPDPARTDIQKLAQEVGVFDVDAWFAYRDEYPVSSEEWEAYLKALASLREPSP
jgi:hypothetical protein